MHHKKKRHPNARAGCAMCKPQKKGGMNPDKELGHKGFGKLRALLAAKDKMKSPANGG